MILRVRSLESPVYETGLAMLRPSEPLMGPIPYLRLTGSFLSRLAAESFKSRQTSAEAQAISRQSAIRFSRSVIEVPSFGIG